MRTGAPQLMKLNDYVMKAQYITFILILKVLFMGVSLALIPFAYLIGVLDKIKTLTRVADKKERVINNLAFIPFGIPILFLDFLMD